MAPMYPGTLAPAETAYDRLRGTVKDLVLGLRLAAEDLDKADPVDAADLYGKLTDLQDAVAAGVRTIMVASAAYDEVPEERER